MREISVLLTYPNDPLSRIMGGLGRQQYTHSSIALEETPGVYYSFNFNGFAVETTERHRRRALRSACYRLAVSDGTYRAVQRRIAQCLSRREDYRYTRLGLVLCVLHLPFRRKNRYFCSQFVAELLQESGAMPLHKAPSRYLPGQFPAELERCAHCVRLPDPML